MKNVSRLRIGSEGLAVFRFQFRFANVGRVRAPARPGSSDRQCYARVGRGFAEPCRGR
jgi:hypothetical protein